MEEEIKLLTEEQAAKRLLITKRYLQQLCREDEIRFVRQSPRKRAFLPEHVQEFIRRRTVTPPKVVDRTESKTLPFPRKGGEKGKSTGDSLSERKRMREDLRSWR